ncbi:MAG: hypothetical protein NTW73_01960 [Candidatus Parcubacteria bacterium]|nr:hypothetical protein [Candidatus Parcubacteria bacterium]
MFFKFKVSKLANLYFFISNLSAWSPYTYKKDYNNFWIEKTGPLTNQEIIALTDFKELHLKYPYGHSYLGNLFTNEKNDLSKISQTLPLIDQKILIQTFELLETRFEKIWSIEEPLLKEWKILLEKYFADLNLKYIFEILEILYDVKIDYSQSMEVFILFSTPDRTGGEASNGPNKLTLKISRYDKNRVSHAIGIILHEIIHLIFEKKTFFPMIFQNVRDIDKQVHLIKETAASSLFPKGILGYLFLNNPIATQLLPQIDQQQSKLCIELMQKYVDNKYKLDNNYIKQIIKILLKKYPSGL